jgi:hypothetical protein
MSLLLSPACGGRWPTPDWRLAFSTDGVAITDEEVPLGVMTATRIRIGLGWDGSDGVQAPRNVLVLPDDGAAVAVGAPDTISVDGTRLSPELYRSPASAGEISIVPLREGSNRVRFLADNTDHVGSFRFRGVTVTDLSVSAGGPSPLDPAADPTLKAFVGSGVRLTTEARGGEEKLRGEALYTVEQPAGFGSTFIAGMLYLDWRPHRMALVGSPPAQRISVEVVNADAIAALGVRLERGDPMMLRVGAILELKVDPLDAGGALIGGYPDGLVSAELAGPDIGDVYVVGTGGVVRFVAASAGETTLRIRWGAAEVMIPVTVVPAP